MSMFSYFHIIIECDLERYIIYNQLIIIMLEGLQGYAICVHSQNILRFSSVLMYSSMSDFLWYRQQWSIKAF